MSAILYVALNTHKMGILRRINLIMTTLGAMEAPGIINFYIYNTRSAAENRGVTNRLYLVFERTNNSIPGAVGTVFDIIGEYPYQNLENPQTEELYAVIIVEGTITSNYNFDIVVDSEERSGWY